MKQCLGADVFITGANALSLDGQMVNIDGNGNRVAAIVYGPESVIVIAGMNKVMDSLNAAVERARTVAAPQNKQRFDSKTPCEVTAPAPTARATAASATRSSSPATAIPRADQIYPGRGRSGPVRRKNMIEKKSALLWKSIGTWSAISFSAC